MIAKTPTIRLAGKPLAALNAEIHNRDNNSCVLCGRWVDPGEKFHHITFKSQGGGDTVDNGATLCQDCHLPKAHGPEAAGVREKLKEYIGRVKHGTVRANPARSDQ